MDNPGYVTLSRQAGLLKDMQVIANNIANLSTDGFRRERAIFAELVDRLAVDGGSTSQSGARVRDTDFTQGGLRATGGAFDFAIEGEGFFQVDGPDGPRLTRAGAFARNLAGELAAADGARLLGDGGAPIFVPAEARDVSVATDGTISADGQPVGRVAVVRPPDLSVLVRGDDGRFVADAGVGPAPEAVVFQGFLERSNVNPVREIARMIDVQRAYEAGQSFLTTEDERIRQAIRVIGAA